MADEKEYPAPPKMATDLTLRGLFAKDAPPVPEWFVCDDLPGAAVAERDVSGELSFPYEYFAWRSENDEHIFFEWRLYYADKMIDLLTSHQ